LRGIRDEIHAITEKQKTAERKNEKPTQIEITAQPGLPVSIGKYYESQNAGWKAKWEKLKIAFEIAAFAGAVVAGIYTVRTFSQIKRQADIAHDQWQDLRHNFEVDQRAWMKVTCPLPVKLIELLSAKTEAKNFGKSTATEVDLFVRIAVVDKGLPPPFAQSENAKSFRAHIGPMFPADVEPFLLSDIAKISGFSLTEPQKKSLAFGDSYVAVYGGVVYIDQFGAHWTRFCNWMAYSLESGYNADACVAFNAIGEGSIIPQK
jgi:hypothetical protein